jgi:hypothetical protein
MDAGNLAPLLAIVTITLTSGGVLILRPISKKLGMLLEAMVEDRRKTSHTQELAQIRDLMTRLDSRLSLIEERQNFTESLPSGERARAPSQLPLTTDTTER